MYFCIDPAIACFYIAPFTSSSPILSTIQFAELIKSIMIENMFILTEEREIRTSNTDRKKVCCQQ